jgi:hypothetical protein
MLRIMPPHARSAATILRGFPRKNAHRVTER